MVDAWHVFGGDLAVGPSGDIAVAWPKPGAPVLIACYTQGGAPGPEALDAVFKEVGRVVGRRLHA